MSSIKGTRIVRYLNFIQVNKSKKAKYLSMGSDWIAFAVG
jgi:hypothetical protein